MALRRFNRKCGLVHTQRSTSTKNFYPGGPADVISDVKQVLFHMEMELTTGDVTARPAVRYSDDGETNWGTPLDIGTETITADGVLSSTTWNSLPGTPKMFAQFGAHVCNTASTDLEFATISFRVEKRNF